MLHRRNGEIIPESVENDSFFYDRNEPYFLRYVEVCLELPSDARDEDISHMMEIQGKATGVISSNYEDWAPFVVLREAQRAQDATAQQDVQTSLESREQV